MSFGLVITTKGFDNFPTKLRLSDKPRLRRIAKANGWSYAETLSRALNSLERPAP